MSTFGPFLYDHAMYRAQGLAPLRDEPQLPQQPIHTWRRQRQQLPTGPTATATVTVTAAATATQEAPAPQCHTPCRHHLRASHCSWPAASWPANLCSRHSAQRQGHSHAQWHHRVQWQQVHSPQQVCSRRHEAVPQPWPAQLQWVAGDCSL